VVSLPLTNTATYTGSVSAVTSNTISVGDSPAPFTTSLATAGSPYFVKFLSGSEMGRVMLIKANTASTLTLDTTDDTIQTVSLTTSGFSVADGDSFEVFPAETLASMFGTNTAQNPLVLNGATSLNSADTISVYNSTLLRFQSFYFNTAAGYWEQGLSTANANNTVLYPYGALTIKRRATNSDTSFVLAGRVTEVPILTKTTGNGSVVFCSTGYATDMTLSQLQYGANWVTGADMTTANTISLWNPTLSRFDTYYQRPDSTWRKELDPVTDVSNTVVAAGSSMAVLERAGVSGASSFLQTPMPYSLN
jgi:uncharacterized protein (TIGR02597 family)